MLAPGSAVAAAHALGIWDHFASTAAPSMEAPLNKAMVMELQLPNEQDEVGMVGCAASACCGLLAYGSRGRTCALLTAEARWRGLERLEPVVTIGSRKLRGRHRDRERKIDLGNHLLRAKSTFHTPLDHE